MRYMKWIGIAAAVLLIISCFTPWVFIESRNITISGVSAPGTNYGKPGYFNFIMTAFFIVFTLTPKIWAKRFNLFVTAINLGWAIRNLFILTSCQGGDCPDKKSGIYLMVAASVIMLISSLFPDMKIQEEKK